MKNIQGHKNGFGQLARGLFALLLVSGLTVSAQHSTGSTSVIEAETDADSSEFVTINVRDANIAEVLKAYSLQTGQSIVVGPDVVSDNVNVRLNSIPWEEALDVILKPYGFGYRVVGDTIVISKLENIVSVEGIEPLVSRVYNLKYLDAYDAQAVCEAQLSARGKFTVLETKSLPGWEFGGSSGSGGSGGSAATDGGIRSRKDKAEIKKSKVFVVTDVPSAVSKIDRILAEMDLMPKQILIEAKFMEISTEDLQDIGIDYLQAIENVEGLGDAATSLTPAPLASDVARMLNMTTGYLDPLDSGASGSYSYETGLHLAHSELFGNGAEMLISFMAQDDDVKVLSAPRILTINNQEAAILVGEKYPIIESDATTGSGSGVVSTSLDYYENIGIQLNVIPQVCDGGYVNMIVHPAVSEIKSFASGVVTADSSSQSGTQYPVLKIREAETQIMIKSENTAVIGGLQNERNKKLVKKVPFLGDIPYIGRLFRKETDTTEKVDLLIFIKATIIDNDKYAAESKEREAQREAAMDMELLRKEEAEEQAENTDETVAVDEDLLEHISEVGETEISTANPAESVEF